MSTRKKATLGVIKDTLLFAIGILGIGYQQWTESRNIPLLLVFVGMVGLPGLTNLIAAIQQAEQLLASLGAITGQQSYPQASAQQAPDSITSGKSQESSTSDNGQVAS